MKKRTFENYKNICMKVSLEPIYIYIWNRDGYWRRLELSVLQLISPQKSGATDLVSKYVVALASVPCFPVRISTRGPAPTTTLNQIPTQPKRPPRVATGVLLLRYACAVSPEVDVGAKTRGHKFIVPVETLGGPAGRNSSSCLPSAYIGHLTYGGVIYTYWVIIRCKNVSLMLYAHRIT